MNQSKKYLFAGVCIALLLGACGGDSGGSGARNVAGNWTGALTKTADTCNPANPGTVNFTHTVTQNQDAVELITEALFKYLGNLVQDDGFSVDGSRQVQIGNNTCTEDSRIEYNNIADDDDAGADVELTSNFTCVGANNCRTDYTGTATRPIAAVPTATSIPVTTPVPGATATPGSGGNVSGGCAAMNPNPAAGEYQGDGGCGISDAVFRVIQETADTVVTLEPFGANGLTTFVINPANSSVATSRRTDLTINGEPGYTCTLTCSPPGTFTAQCLREGGTSCTEKF